MKPDFDFQGHRGCRGLFPENTIEGFIEALNIGVTTLEMDVVISKDLKVVVSHEPFFNHEITTTPEGKFLTESNEKDYNLYRLDYSEIKKFDCGLKPHPRFPRQKKIPAIKPILDDVIEAAETFNSRITNIPVKYNIEIKSTIEGDNIYHPAPSQFAELLIEVLKRKNVLDRCIIQCFDVRTLQYIHEQHPEVLLSFLVENNEGHIKNFEKLGFITDIYSPEFIYVDEALMTFCKEKSIKVIPWTINEISEMKKLISLGVDGLISDFPNLYKLL
ncbi:MAG: glycerophosphodiester phosphodiesterase family protein [Cytophagaceae bacterium]